MPDHLVTVEVTLTAAVAVDDLDPMYEVIEEIVPVEASVRYLPLPPTLWIELTIAGSCRAASLAQGIDAARLALDSARLAYTRFEACVAP